MAFKVLRQLSPASATTQDYTSTGFGTPTVAIIYATQAAADNTAADGLNLSFGVYDGTTQWMCGGNSEHGQGTTDTDRISSTTNCLQLATPGTTTTIVAATASFITDGVRLSFSTASSQVLVTVILFNNVGEVWAGTVTLSTQDTEVNVTSPGFEPNLLIACSIGATSVTSGSFFSVSLGFASQATQKCFAWSSSDSAAISAVNAILYSNRIAAQTTTWSAEASNFDADGFSLTARGGDSGGDLVFVLAMECPSNDVWVGGFTNPTTLDATWDVSNASFQPDFALEVYTACGAEDASEADADAGVFAIGVATADEEMCISLSEGDNLAATDNQSFVDADTMVRVRGDTGGALLNGQFDSFQATGRRVTISGTPAAAWRHFGLQMTSGVSEASANLAESYRTAPRPHRRFDSCELWLEPLGNVSIPNLCGRSDYWTVTGGPVLGWGPSCMDLTYDGSNDLASFDQSVIPSYPFLLLVEFQTTNTTAANRCLFSQSNSTGPSKLGLRLNSSHQVQAFVGSNTVTFAEAANDGNYHTAGLLADSSGTVYVVYDGEIGSSVAGGTFPALDRSTIGAVRSTTTTEYFPGSIARVTVHSKYPAVGEIQTLIEYPNEWRRTFPFELLIGPEEEPEPALIISPAKYGGYPGSRVNPTHRYSRGIEAWLPLNHPIDASFGRSIYGNISGVNTNTTFDPGGRVAGRVGFNGDDSSVVYPSIPGLSFTTGETITISALIYVTNFTATRMAIVGKDGDGFAQFNYMLSVADPGQLDFHFRESGVSHHWRTTDIVVGAEIEHLVTASFTFGDPNSAIFTVDGNEVDGFWYAGDGDGIPITGTGDLRIGSRSATTWPFEGYISDVRIYRSHPDTDLLYSILNDPWAPLLKGSLLDLYAEKILELGLATEEDTARNIAVLRKLLIGRISESDTALSLVHTKSRLIGIVTEADTSRTIARAKAEQIGRVSETDEARDITSVFGVVANITIESDLALSADFSKLTTITKAVETNQALPASYFKAVMLGIVEESDMAQMVTFSAVLGLPFETDTAITAEPFKTAVIGRVDESDSASAISTGFTVNVSRVTELDKALRLSLVVGLVTEMDLAFEVFVVAFVIGPGKAQYVSRSRKPQYIVKSERLGSSPVSSSLAPLSQEGL